jgi:hypothetical protein
MCILDKSQKKDFDKLAEINGRSFFACYVLFSVFKLTWVAVPLSKCYQQIFVQQLSPKTFLTG